MAAIDAGGLVAGQTEAGGEAGAEADEGRRLEADARPEGERRPRGRGRQRRERGFDENGTATAGDRLEAATETAEDRQPSPAEVSRFQKGPRAVSIGEESVETAGEEPFMTAEPLAASPDVAPTGVAPQPVELASPPTQAPIEPFVLPLGTLEAIAESAGLQWVNSDAEKIRAAREAMAREPAPIHVPRERKPVERIDEGPLVLVETRKDLSQIKLPFENAQQETQGRS
jgi:ribonuclease E